MLNLIKRHLRLVLALSSAAFAVSTSVADDAVPSREDLTTGSVTATVTAIDRPSRSVVLTFKDGREEAFVLGEEIKNISDINVGDTFLAGFARSLGLELRAATASELANPLDVTEQMEVSIDKTGTGRAGQLIRAVTTVEVLDRINMTATLKGPLGNYLTIDVKDPELMTKVNIGQTVVATFTEAVVLSLTKTE